MIVKLKDVVTRVNNNIDRFNTDIEYYLGKGHGECGEIAITERGNLKKDVGMLGFKFHFAFEPGDSLFFSRSFALRKAGMAMYTGICSDSTYIIRTKDINVLLPDYLPVIIQSDVFWEYCDTHHTGGVNFLINWSTLADYEFELPPLAEQRVLADILWAAYRLKESYKKLLAATSEMVKSQFIEMFGNNKPTEKQGVLADFCTLKAGKSVKSGDISDSYEEGLYPCYGGNGLRGYVSSYSHDGIYNIIGRQGALCGNVNIVNGKFYATEHAVVVTPKEQIAPYWLYFALSEMNLNQYARGVAQPGLAVNQLEQLPFTIPSMALQKQFVAIAEQADKSGFDGCKSQFIEMFGSVESTKPLADFIEVSFPGEWGQEDKDGSGIKVIRTTNFTNNGKLDLSDVVTRDIDSVKVEKKKLSKGDIILERSGGTNENPVGRVVYFEEDGVYLFNNFTQLLRCKEGVNSLFIFYSLFNYYQMNKNVIRSMGNKTTGIQNLKMERYWQIPIADVSIERQKEFETIYRQADKSGFELRKSIEAIDSVIKSLINS